MAAAVGLAVALSGATDGSSTGAAAPVAAHDDQGHALAPLTVDGFLTQWRPAPVTTAVVLAVLGVYLHLAARPVRGTAAWPRRRSAAAVAAALVTLLAFTGAVAVHSTASLRWHVLQHLLLLAVVPVLMTAARPLTLLQRHGYVRQLAEGPAGPAVRTLRDPVRTCAAMIVVLFLVYGTPLLELTLTSPAVHLATTSVALLTGSAFWWSVLAADAVPAPAPATDRRTVLAAALVFLLCSTAVLATRDVAIATSWKSISSS